MNKINLNLRYRFPVYIAALLVPVLIWSIVFSALSEPRENERLSVAYFGGGCDISALSELISADISEISDQKILEFNFNTAISTKSDMIISLMEARMYTSDILIFSGDMWENDLLKYNMAPIPENTLDDLKAELPADAEYHCIDGRVYGVFLKCAGRETVFSSYYDKDDRPLLVFSSYSQNLNTLYGKGRSGDSAAIDLARYLLSEVKK